MKSHKYTKLNHSSPQSVNHVLSVAKVATLDKVVGLLSPSTSGVVKLEGPQEVAGILEVGTNSVDFVDQVLNTDDVLLAQVSFNCLIRFDGDTLSSHLDKSTFVDKFSNRLQVWSTPGNIRLTDSQHVYCGFIKLDEHSIVDLSETKELQHFLNLGCHLIDTTDTHDKGKLRLRRHVKVSFSLSIALQPNLVKLFCSVLLDVSLSTLEVLGFLLFLQNSSLGRNLSSLSPRLCLPLSPLQNSLWNRRQFTSWHFDALVEVNQAILSL